MMPPVVIIGSGGHTRVLIDCLQLIGREVLFCTEVAPERCGQLVDGILIKGPDELIFELNPDEVQLVNGIGSIGKPVLRQKIYERFIEQQFEFTSVIHPSAIIAKSAVINDGAQVMARAVVQPGSTIGSNSIVNTGAIVDHDCCIDAHCHVAPRVAISGGVVIGKCSHIGTGANVIQGIRIGIGCTIGAGATVVSDLPSDTIAIGTPAKSISKKS